MAGRKLTLAFFVAALFVAAPALAYTSPGSPTGYVNDFAGVMSEDAKSSLEAELVAFEKETSNEITVAIVPNLGGDYIENYAVKLFEEWGVGKADKDNGALFLLAIEDREVRIEVGYGLEGALPDSLAQRILDEEVTPHLRNGDYDLGVTAGIRYIAAATKGEYRSDSAMGNITWLADNFFFIIMAVLFGFQWLAAILARSKSWWAGGLVGAGGGLALGWFATLSPFFTGFLAILIGFFGLVLDYIVSGSYQSHKRSGTQPPWWAGGGGGGFGGSSRGGGFGGFGGGMSGGGGASGRW
jgi:uncharacterized protein